AARRCAGEPARDPPARAGARLLDARAPGGLPRRGARGRRGGTRDPAQRARLLRAAGLEAAAPCADDVVPDLAHPRVRGRARRRASPRRGERVMRAPSKARAQPTVTTTLPIALRLARWTIASLARSSGKRSET